MYGLLEIIRYLHSLTYTATAAMVTKHGNYRAVQYYCTCLILQGSRNGHTVWEYYRKPYELFPDGIVRNWATPN